MPRCFALASVLLLGSAACYSSHSPGEDDPSRPWVGDPDEPLPGDGGPDDEPPPDPGPEPEPEPPPTDPGPAPELPAEECFGLLWDGSSPVSPADLELASGRVRSLSPDRLSMNITGTSRTATFTLSHAPVLHSHFTRREEVTITHYFEDADVRAHAWMLEGASATAYAVTLVVPLEHGRSGFGVEDLWVDFGEPLCQVTEESGDFCESGSYLRRSVVYDMVASTGDGSSARVEPGEMVDIGDWTVGYGRAETQELLRACEGLDLERGEHRFYVQLVRSR